MTETPILDGLGAEGVAAPEPGARIWVVVVAGVLVGIFLRYFAPVAAALPRGRPAAVLGWAVLAYAVTVVIHELGHAAAGLAAGFRLLSISFGPVGFSQVGRRWRVDVVRGPLGRGGGTSVVPRETAHLRRRMVLMVAGGPAATLALAAAALAGIRAGHTGLFGWLLLGIAAVTALLSLVPQASRELVNDGAHLWKLCRGGPAASRMCAIFALSGMDTAGIPPEKWDREWLRLAVGGEAGADAALGETFGYYHHIAGDEPEPAAEHLERALALADAMGPARRATLYLEAAFVHAWWRRDGVRARAWLEDARRLRALPGEALSGAETAVLAGEGRLDEARAKARETLAFLDRRGLYTGVAFSERRWLGKVLEMRG